MLRRRKKQPDLTVATTDRSVSDAVLHDRPLKFPAGRLGEILVSEGVITPAQLTEALAKKSNEGGFLGQNLIELGFINQNTLTTFLVKQCKIPHLNLMDYQIDESVVRLVDKDLCGEYGVIPIDKMGRILTLAMVDPLDVEALEAIRAATPELRIKPILCNADDFQTVYTRLFPDEENTSALETVTTDDLKFSKAPAARPVTTKPHMNEPVAPTQASPDVPAPGAYQSAIVEPGITHAADTRTAADPARDGERFAAILRESVVAGMQSLIPSLKQEFASLQMRMTESSMDERFVRLTQSIESITQRPAAQSPATTTPDLDTLVRKSVQAAVEGAVQKLATPSTQPAAPETLAKAVETGMDAAAAKILAVIRHDEHPEALEAKLEGMAEALRRLVESSEVLHAAREAEQRTIAAASEHQRRGSEERAHHAVRPFPVAPPKSGAGAETDGAVLAALESGAPMAVYQLDEFLPGAANDVTFKMAKSIAAIPGKEFNPFYLCGSVGLGKTHLINAIGNAVVNSQGKLRVGYTSASRFATHLADAAEHQALREFRSVYCRWDVLILDDIQFLAGAVEAQEEFFHIFNSLQQEGRQIIIAGDKPPEQLGMLEQRLISRFAGGIVAQVRPPEWETRVEILRLHAKKANANVPEEVLALLAMRISNDIRKLAGGFLKILAYAKIKGVPVSMPLAAEVLAEIGIGFAA